MLMVKMTLIYRQQLPQAYLLLVPEQRYTQWRIWSCYNAFTPQKYTCVQTRSLLRIRMNYSDYRLTYITFYHGAYARHLGLEQLKDRTVKSSVLFQCSSIYYYSKVFARFLNKTQRFLCMTLSSLSFVVFLDSHQGINGICLLSSLKICGIFGI
jgi:hypothetical protein